jgi:hypothetical protein
MDIKFDQRDIPHLAYISNSYGCQAVFDIQSACWVSSQIYSAKGDWTAIALNNDSCYLAFPGDSYQQINVFKNTSLGYNPLESITASSMFDMEIDNSGELVLAYRDINGNLWVAQHNMFGWTSQRITNSNETIYDSVSITCGSRGPAIAYRQTGTNNIILATCHAGWTKTIIDSNQDTRYLDIAFDDEGKPFISWYDFTNRCHKISGMGMTQTCPADYNNDGIVNNVDLAILVNDFGKDLPDGLTEMDGYSKIDKRDLRVFATYWLWQRPATN